MNHVGILLYSGFEKEKFRCEPYKIRKDYTSNISGFSIVLEDSNKNKKGYKKLTKIADGVNDFFEKEKLRNKNVVKKLQKKLVVTDDDVSMLPNTVDTERFAYVLKLSNAKLGLFFKNDVLVKWHITPSA